MGTKALLPTAPASRSVPGCLVPGLAQNVPSPLRPVKISELDACRQGTVRSMPWLRAGSFPPTNPLEAGNYRYRSFTSPLARHCAGPISGRQLPDSASGNYRALM
ncbi:predicted protein [Coccidioides posadasii str. Silveira]|uniref:Predicted protein n=1 Tax=Coccidioides posadasii (strain RMSCC 757 / Silveira) TaxID=443226 RepID=E9D7U4_COCPS|nr:predicted protein [Coccidioides posadasii str. Silveira]